MMKSRNRISVRESLADWSPLLESCLKNLENLASWRQQTSVVLDSSSSREQTLSWVLVQSKGGLPWLPPALTAKHYSDVRKYF